MNDIFGIGLPELISIIIIAGIVMGPKRIAQFARWLGKTTAYLQNVSRGFAMQLRNELDELDEGGDMKDMLEEMRNLQKEVGELRKQVRTTAMGAVTETKDALQEGKDALNSIKPPSLTDTQNGSSSTEQVPENSMAPPQLAEPKEPPTLPNVVDVPDDPE